MLISIDSMFYGELFQARRTPNTQIKFNELYRRFIYLTILNNLDYLFKPNSLFGRGYERTDEIEGVVNDILIDSANVDQLEVDSNNLFLVEDTIRKYLKKVISTDGHDWYGMYSVELNTKTTTSTFMLRCLGDFRIKEWEQGRGRNLEEVLPLDDMDDDSDTDVIDSLLSIERPRRQPSVHYDTIINISSPKVQNQDSDIVNHQVVRDIKKRIEEDRLVTDEERELVETWDSRDNEED